MCSNAKNALFQMRECAIFEKKKRIASKYENFAVFKYNKNMPFLNTKNVPSSNTKNKSV